MSAKREILNVDRVNFSYGKMQVLHDVSLKVYKGEVVTVIGSNGVGKTTLVNCMCGILRPNSGEITFITDGTKIEVNRIAPEKVVAHGLICIPERRRIFPYMTVMENLELGAYLPESRRKKKETLDWVFTLFPILKERKKQLAGTLSGGEQQMLAIARGLMARPKMLLLDEPSLGLAPKIVQTIFDIIKTIRKAGTTILLVEQNAREALEIADRGYVLETGRIVLEGSAKELASNEDVRKIYLGI